MNKEGGRSANKFRKSHIRKFADLHFLKRFTDFPQMWQFADNIFFADLKLSQIHNIYPYKYKLRMLSFKFKDDFMDELHGLL
jgi:hypothetical protein